LRLTGFVHVECRFRKNECPQLHAAFLIVALSGRSNEKRPPAIGSIFSAVFNFRFWEVLRRGIWAVSNRFPAGSCRPRSVFAAAAAAPPCERRAG
jgi:hypothetical protein